MSEPKSDLNEQYFFNCSYYSKNFHYTNEGNDTLFYTNNSKTVDLRFSNSNLNVPDNSTTKFSSSENVLTKDITKSSMNIVPQQGKFCVYFIYDLFIICRMWNLLLIF